MHIARGNVTRGCVGAEFSTIAKHRISLCRAVRISHDGSRYAATSDVSVYDDAQSPFYNPSAQPPLNA